MRFRRLTPKNIPRAKFLLGVIFPFLGIWWLAQFFWLKKQTTELYEVRKKREMAGLVGTKKFSFFGIGILFLSLLAVHPKFQGKGFGKKVLKHLEKDSRKSGFDYLMLTSSPTRERAQKFYFRNGFKRLLGFVFWKKLKE